MSNTNERNGTTRRKEIIDAVSDCVLRDRQNMYSDAEDNFQDIATVCNVILRDKLRTPLEPEDIATIHAATKLCRIKTSPMHQDNWVDLAGYAVCGGGIAKKKNEEPVAVAPLLNRKPGGITFTRDWRGI